MNTQNFIKKIKESRKNSKVLRNILTVLGCLVFFVTTYVFLLPALAYSDPIDYTLTFNREKTIEKYTETIIENEETKEVEKQREIDNNVYAKINYVYFEKNNKDDTLYYLNHNSLIVDKNMKLEDLFANSTTIEQDETIYEFEEVEIYINDEWIKLENEQVELKDNNWYIGEYQIDNNTNLRVVYTYEYEENTIIEEAKELAETIIEKPKAIFRSFAATPSTDPENLTQDQICDTTPKTIEELSQNTYSRGSLVNPCNGKSVDKVAIYTGSFVNEGDVQVRKIVEKTDTLGKYNVRFQVRGKEIKDSYAKDIYIVVVMDVSGSMENYSVTEYRYCKKMYGYWTDNCKFVNNDQGDHLDSDWSYEYRDKTVKSTVKKWDNAKNGAKTFATNILTKLPNTKLALVRYSGYNNKNDGAWNDAEKTRGFSNTNFNSVNFEKAFSGTDNGNTAAPNGGTNTEAGLRAAKEMLKTAPSDAIKYVVLISDGEPTFYYNKDGKTGGEGNNEDGDSNGNFATSKQHAIDEKTALLNTKGLGDTTFFAIGYDVPLNGRAENFLKNDIATEPGNYYAADPDTITNAFNAIAENIKAPAGTISTTQGVFDKKGENFTWDNSSNVEVHFKPTEKIDITEEWKTIGSYTTEGIDESSMDALYKTNDGFKLTFSKTVYNSTTHQTTEVQKEIPCNINPYAYWSQTNLIINYYYDGIKDDSKTQTLESGGQTGFIYTEGMIKGINNQNVQDNLKDGYIFIDVKDKNGTVINPTNGEYNILIKIERGTNIINVYYVSGHELPETGSRGELICLYMGLTIMLGTLIYGYIYYKKETN